MKRYLTLLIVLIAYGTMLAVPLNEGFEGTAFPPVGWTLFNLGDTNTWVRDSDWDPHTGVAQAKIEYSSSAHNDWLITPRLLPSAQNHSFSFWARNFVAEWPDKFNVKLSTGTTNIGDFTVDLATNISPPGTYTKYTYSLSDYIGIPVYIAVQAISADQWMLFVDDFKGPDFYTPPGPPTPTTVVSPTDGASEVFEKAILKWTPLLSATGYKLNFGKMVNGVRYPILTNFDNGLATSYTHPGLLDNSTTYYWEVIPYNIDGSATGFDTWTFTTRASITKNLDQGWVVNFAGADQGLMPEDWYRTDEHWFVYPSNNAGGLSPELVFDSDPRVNGKIRAISPPLYGENDDGYMFRFKHKVSHYSIGYTLKIEASTDLDNWTTLWSISPTTTVNAINILLSNNLTAFLDTPFYLAWTFDGDTYGIFNWFVDDISIMPILDTAPAPPILTYPGESAESLPKDGFIITWEPDLTNGGMPDYYVVYLSQDDGDIGQNYFETTWTRLNPATYIDSNSSAPITFEYLERYYWTVEAYREGFQPAMADIRWFRIEDDPTIQIGQTPWREGFEGDTFPPEGWIMVDADGDGYNWFSFESEEYAHSGSKSAASASYVNYVGPVNPDNWLITPPIALPATGEYMLEYYIAAQDPYWSNERFGLYISPSGSADLDEFELAWATTLFSSDWQYKTKNLTAYAGQTIRFAFCHYNCTDQFLLKLDDVQVRLIPTSPILTITPPEFDFGETHIMTPTTPATFTLTNTGIGTINLIEGDIWLDPLEEDFVLVAQDLPTQIGVTTRYNFTVQFIPQTVGQKTATLYIRDNVTRAIHEVTLTGIAVEEPVASVISLEGMAEGRDSARLNWASVYGDPSAPGYVHWDDSIYRGGVGAGANQFHVAVKYGSEITNLMADTMIDGVMIHIFEQPQTVDYLRIWSGTNASLAPSQMVYQQQVSGLNAGWNYIALTTPVNVSAYEAITVGYHVNGIANTFPGSTDGLAAVNGRGNIVESGGNWFTLVDANLDGNWLVHTHFESSQKILQTRRPRQLTPVSVVANTLSVEELHNLPFEARAAENAQRALRGFNIYRNNVQINANIVAAYTYLDANLAPGTYQYAVQPVHYSTLGPISQSVQVQILSDDSIPPVITHLPLLNTPITSYPYEVIAHVVDDAAWNSPIAEAKLHYATNGGAFITVNMQAIGNDLYRGYIHAQSLNTDVEYYFTAKDSQNNQAQTNVFEFTIAKPAWLQYDTSVGEYMGYGMVFGPAVIFNNPFYPSGVPMQLLKTSGSTYYTQEATLIVFDWDGTDWEPVFADYVEFNVQSDDTFDLEDEQIIIAGTKFLVTYLDIAATNYFLLDDTYDYDTSRVIIDGQLYSMGDSGQWSIAALVTNAPSLEAPVITIALNTEGNPELSWAPVLGANAYQIESATHPYADTWTPYDTTEDTSLVINDSSATERFFQVKAVQINMAKRQNAPTLNITNESYSGATVLKALKSNNVMIKRK